MNKKRPVRILRKRSQVPDDVVAKKEKRVAMRKNPIKHYYQPMSVFLDFATSQSPANKTPCAVNIPTIKSFEDEDALVQDDDNKRWEAMKQPKAGVFVLPQGPFKYHGEIPSFKEENRVPEFEMVIEKIKATNAWKVLEEAMYYLEAGLFLEDKTNTYAATDEEYYDDGRALDDMSEFTFQSPIRSQLQFCNHVLFRIIQFNDELFSNCSPPVWSCKCRRRRKFEVYG